jgi:hypothetical protein
MWANSVWGFFGLAVTLALATLGLPEWLAFLRPWFIGATGISLITATCTLCWPFIFRLRASRDTAYVRDATLLAAIWRAYLGEWEVPENGGLGKSTEEGNRFKKIAEHEFRQLAFDGKLPIWARRPNNHLWEEIPKELWRDYHIDYLTAWAPPLNSFDIMAVHHNRFKAAAPANWRDLMTSRAAVEKMWPNT